MKPNKEKLQKVFNKLIKKVKSEKKFRLENNFEYEISIFKTYTDPIGVIKINEDNAKPEMFFYFNNRSTTLNPYKDTLNDKKFREKWSNQVKELLAKQHYCKKCNKEWNIKDKIIPQLHHYKMDMKKIQAKRQIEQEVYFPILKGKITLEKGYKKFVEIEKKILSYYKSLKDTELICYLCHVDKEGLTDVAQAYKNAKINQIKLQHKTLDKF